MSGVFANTREVSGKATPNKTIAAFPDVCMSPPSPPAGPVPIPYPITGISSDTQAGTGSVHIGKKEVGKKNGSKYGKVNGNQPATNSFGAGVISHKITGPLKFAAYSFDVVFEKDGAERFMDMTTQNHMNNGNTSPGFNVAALDPLRVSSGDQCAAMQKANEDTFEAIADPANSPDATKRERRKLNAFPRSGTISHATFDNCGQRTVHRGASSGAVSRLDNSFSKPPPSTEKYLVDHPKGEKNKKGKVKKRIKSKICDKDDFTHPRGGMHAHSEPAILEKLPYKELCPGATLTMAIDWHQANPKNRSEPNRRDDACGNCEKVLKAACQCIDIKLCKKNGEVEDACKKPDAAKEKAAKKKAITT